MYFFCINEFLVVFIFYLQHIQHILFTTWFQKNVSAFLLKLV